jgi:hypothetical protein
MALSHFPRIVTNGLVLGVDQQNSKSFKGVPTTNEVATPTNISTWSTGAGSSSVANSTVSPDGNATAALYEKSASSANGLWRPSLQPAGTYTYAFSVYIKRVNWDFIGLRVAGLTMPESGIIGSSHAVFSFATESFTYLPVDYKNTYIEKLENGWYRVGLARTPITEPETTGGWYYGLCAAPSAANGAESWDSTSAGIINFYAWGAQFEDKPFVTPFTLTSRSNTQSLYDMTGNNIITMNGGEVAEENNTFSFDGISAGATSNQTRATLLTSPNVFSYSAWIKYNGIVGGDIIFGCQGFNNGILSSATKVALASHWHNNGAGSWTPRTFLATTSVVDDTWYHVTMTFDEDADMKLYVNGVEEGSLDVSGFLKPWYTPTVFCISGGPSSVYAWSGFVNYALIYDKVITQDEVLQIFNATRGRFGI